MRTDIYVVQKTAEEGKHLEDWCIQNDVTVNMNYGLGFNPEWNCFAYFNSIDAFCKNYKLSSCKLNMQEVTIEEFKRLQLESLGKTEELKIGDYVTVTDEDVNSEFKMIGKVIEVRSDKDESNIRGKADFIFVDEKEFKSNSLWCYRDNGGRNYRKSTKEEIEWLNECIRQGKFVELSKPEFITGKWYKILDNWWAKFKTVHNSGNRWQFSEHIDKNGAYSNIIQSIDVISEIKLLTDLSEIQEYLPLNHSDLIVKNICPEYVEYIDTKYKGQIVRVTEWSSANYCKIHHPIDGILKPFKDLVKPSTQEAFNKQSDSNKGFIVGEWYTCRCNKNFYRFHSLNDVFFVNDAVINPTSEKHAKSEKGFTERIAKSYLEYFNPDKKAPLDVVNKFLPKKFDYEVVHCKTQEEWDFVCETLCYKHANKHWKKSDYCCINLNEDLSSTLDWYENSNAKIYSFKEWCNNNGYSFEPVKQEGIDFEELNLEDWLRETKKLNLSKKELAKHLNSPESCKCFEVYDKLKGGNEHEKAEILWNEWNGITGECTLTPQYPIRPTEAYKMISELQCIKPSIIKHKAQLVEVNKKQIFKN